MANISIASKGVNRPGQQVVDTISKGRSAFRWKVAGANLLNAAFITSFAVAIITACQLASLAAFLSLGIANLLSLRSIRKNPHGTVTEVRIPYLRVLVWLKANPAPVAATPVRAPAPANTPAPRPVPARAAAPAAVQSAPPPVAPPAPVVVASPAAVASPARPAQADPAPTPPHIPQDAASSPLMVIAAASLPISTPAREEQENERLETPRIPQSLSPQPPETTPVRSSASSSSPKNTAAAMNALKEILRNAKRHQELNRSLSENMSPPAAALSISPPTQEEDGDQAVHPLSSSAILFSPDDSRMREEPSPSHLQVRDRTASQQLAPPTPLSLASTAAQQGSQDLSAMNDSRLTHVSELDRSQSAPGTPPARDLPEQPLQRARAHSFSSLSKADADRVAMSLAYVPGIAASASGSSTPSGSSVKPPLRMPFMYSLKGIMPPNWVSSGRASPAPNGLQGGKTPTESSSK